MNITALGTTIAEGLKSQPAVLASFFVVMAALAVVVYELQAVFASQREVNALLTKCVDMDLLKQLGIFK